MAARTLNWAQRVVNGPATTFGANLNASSNTALNPVTAVTAMSATAQAFEVQAGVAISIRWGGDISSLFGKAVAANTATWTLNCFNGTGQNLWELAATDTLTQVGAAIGSCDRTLTFTPTNSGTIRLFVRYRCVVTVGGAAVADINTDGGNFGSPAAVLPATSVSVDFTPGLLRAGTTLVSLVQSGGNGAGVYATFGKTIVNTLNTGHAPRSSQASQTYTISWRQVATQFASTAVPSGTTVAAAGPGLLVVNAAVTGWPNKVAFSPRLVLTPDNSTLSTANGGAGLPWNHFSTVPTGPGTVTTTLSATGKIISVTFDQAFSANNVLQHQRYLQLNVVTVNTPPDGISNATFNVTSRTAGDVGEVTHRVKDANGAGVNGIAYTTGSITMTDIGGLTATQTRAGNNLATTALGGADGWLTASTGLGGANANFLAWTGGSPRGTWHYNWVISTTNAIGLDSPASPETFTLQVTDPNIIVTAFVNGVGASAGGMRHIKPGDTLTILATATSTITKKRVTIESGSIWMTHFNVATNQLENLISATDDTSAAWILWGQTDAYVEFALVTGADPTLPSKSFAATAGWGNYPLVIRVDLVIAGVHYPFFFVREMPGSSSDHGAPATGMKIGPFFDRR